MVDDHDIGLFFELNVFLMIVWRRRSASALASEARMQRRDAGLVTR